MPQKNFRILSWNVNGIRAVWKKGFLDYLSERMKQAAAELRFEDAQFYKSQIIFYLSFNINCAMIFYFLIFIDFNSSKVANSKAFSCVASNITGGATPAL